jgi:hypothetical protein
MIADCPGGPDPLAVLLWVVIVLAGAIAGHEIILWLLDR